MENTPARSATPPPPPPSQPHPSAAAVAAAAAAAIVTPSAPAQEGTEEEGADREEQRTEENFPAAAEKEKEELVTQTKHVDVFMHTNPRSPRPPSSPSPAVAGAVVSTPSTQRVVKCQPATVAQAEKETEVSVKGAAQAAEAEEGYAKLHSVGSSYATPESLEEGEATSTPPPPADAEAVEETADASPEAHGGIEDNGEGADAPASRRQLTYSKSPEACNRIKRRPPPSRVIVVERQFAATMHTVKVETKAADDQTVEAREEQHGEGQSRQAEVELHAVLEAHISAVMEEIDSSAASVPSDGEDDVQELSAIEKETSTIAPP